MMMIMIMSNEVMPEQIYQQQDEYNSDGKKEELKESQPRVGNWKLSILKNSLRNLPPYGSLLKYLGILPSHFTVRWIEQK